MGTEKGLTFAAVLKNPIYKNRNVLYELMPPGGFLHRLEQKNELIMELSPILMDSAVSCLFVYGNPGTGKTGVILELADELGEEAQKHGMSLKVAYVNTSENRTETSILIELLNKLDEENEYPRMGWTRTKAVSEFNKLLNRLKCQILIVLDEVDYVLKESGDDILYRLSRINKTAKSKVSTVIISNDIRVSDFIKPKTQSTIGRVKVIFSPYNATELADILKGRVPYAFHKGVVTPVILKKIAEIESSRDGDARKALELLDSCAKIAIAKKKTKITLELVNQAFNNLERDHILNTIATLTKHQKLVYLAVLNNQKKMLGGADVYKFYLEVCLAYDVKPLSERRVRSLLIHLDEIGLIESEVGWLSDLRKKTRKVQVNLESALKNKARKLLRDSI
jgi:archaeal cell division control protein 6